MNASVCFLGFGEAAQSFCGDDRWQGRAAGFDINLSKEKSVEFQTFGVTQKNTINQLSENAETVISVVTADQALIAARNASGHLKPGALFLDMNSVAPTTKQKAAEIMQGRGVDYVDVAIMAPVNPKQLDVPLLTAGGNAERAANKLSNLGFQNIRIVGEKVGQASSIKMLRSVMIKGIEALTAECATAAARAGVVEEVFGSMGADWLDQADYKLDRMMVHGERRAAEMEEVVKTLESLGVSPLMSEVTVKRQREIGSLGFNPPPANITEKLDAINTALKEATK